MTGVPNGPWFTSLPPCETLVPCGQGQHSVRWEAGELRLPSHADPEAELVLAALGGDKARCVEIGEAWARHVADLTVLGIGPRGPADEVAVTWDDVDAAGQAARGGSWAWTGSGPAGRRQEFGVGQPAEFARFQTGDRTLLRRRPLCIKHRPKRRPAKQTRGNHARGHSLSCDARHAKLEHQWHLLFQ